ncbi:MAG TPA: DUF4197 domain-containing protein [Burkholderiaceae bacterium]|nr:DUF4197 domain-containing protein [Burkholderiaceae bacterium]
MASGDERAAGFAERRALLALGAAAGLVVVARARAEGMLQQLSEGEASAGLRAALERGAGVAVDLLGKADGFWGNDRVRIPLPDWLHKAEGTLRMLGRGKDVDELHVGINRAAEQAVPAARPLLVDAVHGMSVQDAKGILTGGDDSVTRFFESHTRTPLGERFLPIVSGVTQKIGLARRYDQIVDRVGSLGLVKPDETRIEPHVTAKALDGLFLMIGDEERKIRADPVGTGSAILKKVFGAL